MQRTRRLEARTEAPAATEALGAGIGACLRGGECIVIAGPLGAGKTTLVRGLCRGLGVPDEVTSPTFILYEAFSGRFPVLHLDLYRLEHDNELEELGVFDPAGDDIVVLAEWGDRSDALLSQSDALVTLSPRGGSVRDITVDCTAAVAAALEEMPAWR
jgi:tRNA threonylcarbamoyladenosine biosynthesis protein TsaE